MPPPVRLSVALLPSADSRADRASERLPSAPLNERGVTAAACVLVHRRPLSHVRLVSADAEAGADSIAANAVCLHGFR